MSPITVPELAAICLGPDKSPWRLKDLLPLYKEKTLSLRSLVAKVSDAKAIYYVEVRDLALMKGVSSLADLKTQWPDAAPSRDTLVALDRLLKSAGATMVYISQDWRTIGIYGTFAAMMAISAKSVSSPLLSEVADVDVAWLQNAANGCLVQGAGTAAAGLIPEPASPVMIGAGIGIFATGALIKIGIALFANDDSADPPATVPLPTQSGEVPASVDPNNPPTTPTDPASLPDTPPATDNSGPVSSTGGGTGPIGDGSEGPVPPGSTPGSPGDPNAPPGTPTNPSGGGDDGLGGLFG
jgi:hypothetical protein